MGCRGFLTMKWSNRIAQGRKLSALDRQVRRPVDLNTHRRIEAASGLYQAIISLMPPHDVYMGF